MAPQNAGFSDSDTQCGRGHNIVSSRTPQKSDTKTHMKKVNRREKRLERNDPEPGGQTGESDAIFLELR